MLLFVCFTYISNKKFCVPAKLYVLAEYGQMGRGLNYNSQAKHWESRSFSVRVCTGIAVGRVNAKKKKNTKKLWQRKLELQLRRNCCKRVAFRSEMSFLFLSGASLVIYLRWKISTCHMTRLFKYHFCRDSFIAHDIFFVFLTIHKRLEENLKIVW